MVQPRVSIVTSDPEARPGVPRQKQPDLRVDADGYVVLSDADVERIAAQIAKHWADDPRMLDRLGGALASRFVKP